VYRLGPERTDRHRPCEHRSRTSSRHDRTRRRRRPAADPARARLSSSSRASSPPRRSSAPPRTSSGRPSSVRWAPSRSPASSGRRVGAPRGRRERAGQRAGPPGRHRHRGRDRRTVLVLAGGLFPVPSAAQVPETVIALHRASGGRHRRGGGGLRRDDRDAWRPRRRHARRRDDDGSPTAVVPFCLAILLAGNAALQFRIERRRSRIQTIIGDVLRAITSLFFRPDPLGPHLPTFAVMAGVALLAAHWASARCRSPNSSPRTGPGTSTASASRRASEGCSGRASSARRSPSRPSFTCGTAPPAGGRARAGLYDVVPRGHRQSHAPLAGLVADPSGVAAASVVWLLRRLVQKFPTVSGACSRPFAGGRPSSRWRSLSPIPCCSRPSPGSPDSSPASSRPSSGTSSPP